MIVTGTEVASVDDSWRQAEFLHLNGQDCIDDNGLSAIEPNRRYHRRA
jgi:hypothetical protein